MERNEFYNVRLEYNIQSSFSFYLLRCLDSIEKNEWMPTWINLLRKLHYTFLFVCFFFFFVRYSMKNISWKTFNSLWIWLLLAKRTYLKTSIFSLLLFGYYWCWLYFYIVFSCFCLRFRISLLVTKHNFSYLYFFFFFFWFFFSFCTMVFIVAGIFLSYFKSPTNRNMLIAQTMIFVYSFLHFCSLLL